MTDNFHSLLLIMVVAAVTIAIRFLPFLIFPEGKPVPQTVVKLSASLPAAVMGMLVVYCLKDVDLLTMPYGLPEFAAVAVVAVLHLWKRNTLLSILAGTSFYVVILHL